MKKILLSATMMVALSFTSNAQSVLLNEDFQNGAPESFSVNPPSGAENFWINFDGDGLPDGSSQNRPGEWFSGTYDITDTNNIVAVSNSWTNDATNPVLNWLITPPLTITDASFSLTWRSAPYQTPLYMDGYKVLVSKTNNLEASFTDTLRVYAEYVSRLNPLPDSTYNSYTFTDGFVFGADGDTNYVAFTGDSARFRGILRPDSLSLAAYAGQTIYIAFLSDTHDDNLLFIDDISVFSLTADAIKENYANNFNMQVFPNPATQATRVNFSVEQYSRVFISILDMEGKLVKQFDKGQLMTGNHFADLDLTNIPQGNYFVQINSNTKTQASKLTITK
jgi:hypothetical protein